MVIDVEVKDGEIVGVETREIRIPLSTLTDYLLDKGFKDEGIWYFRGSWMKNNILRFFEQVGIVERMGTSDFLRKQGVKVPNTPIYTGKGSGLVYRVNDPEINKLVQR